MVLELACGCDEEDDGYESDKHGEEDSGAAGEQALFRAERFRTRSRNAAAGVINASTVIRAELEHADRQRAKQLEAELERQLASGEWDVG